MKVGYLARLRSRSAYPAFRALVTFLAVIAYIGAGLLIAVGVMSENVKVGAMFAGGALLLAFLARVAQETSLMLADIADAVLDFAGNAAAATKVDPVLDSLLRQPNPRR